MRCKTCNKEYEPRFFDPKYIMKGYCSEGCLPDRSFLIMPENIPRHERINPKLMFEFFKQEVNSKRNKVYTAYFDVVKKVVSKEFFIGIAKSIAYFLFLLVVLSYTLNKVGFEYTLIIISVYFIVSMSGLAQGIGAAVKQLEKLNS